MTYDEPIRTEGEPRIDIAGLPQPPAWTADALCAQVDLDGFYPEKGGSTRSAKSVCASCPVIRPCLQYALDNEERFGIWGGTSERERRRIPREIAAAKADTAAQS